MNACDHQPAPDERTRDGECIYCVRELARAAHQAPSAKPDEITGATAGAGSITVQEWLKQPGDSVAIGDPVVSLLVGGKSVVVTSEMTGTLGIHKAKSGATVTNTTLLARISPPRNRSAPAAAAEASPPVEPVASTAPVEARPAATSPFAESSAGVEAVAPPASTSPLAQGIPAAEEAAPTVDEQPPAEFVPEPEEQAVEPLPTADDPPAAPPPPAEDIVELRPDVPTDAGPAEQTALQNEDERIIERLETLRRDGVFIISLIGFYEGGKTWFLNRLKYELDQKGYALHPPFEKSLTEVARTNNVAIHLANSYDRKREQSRTFAIVDFPGETLKQLIEHPLESSRSLIAAMQMGGALIISMPADEVLLSRYATDAKRRAARDGAAPQPAAFEARIERLAVADAMLSDFTNEIGFLIGLLSLLRVRGGDQPGAPALDGIDVDAVWSHLTSPHFRPYRQPTYVALTKADMIFQPDALVEQLIGPENCADFAQVLLEPREAVLEHRPTLVGKLDQRFDLYKFDFAAAFEGHGTDKRIDYHEPHRGIWAVIDWIAWCRRLGALTPKEQAAMNRARRLRDHRDGSLSVSLNGLDERVEAD